MPAAVVVVGIVVAMIAHIAVVDSARKQAYP